MTRGVLVLLAAWAALWPLLARGADPFKGEKLFARHCVRCHGEDGRGAIPGAPDFSWRGNGRNGLLNPDRALLARVRAGGATCPAYIGIMNDEEILDVIAHLRTFH